MPCGNRRFETWNHKPGEVISYQQDFLSVLTQGVTATSITAISIGPDPVLIINETVDLPNAIWRGQLLMAAAGDGLVELRAEFSDSQVLFDYFHICTRTEEVAVC